jgi:hypothetical protein
VEGGGEEEESEMGEKGKQGRPLFRVAPLIHTRRASLVSV